MLKLTLKKKIGRRVTTPLLRRSFEAMQRLGVHIVRNHFYEPVPDTRKLPRSLWLKHSDLPGVDMNEKGQLRLLADVFPHYMHECDFPDRPTGAAHEYHFGNESFEALDAEVLHTFVRHFKPRQIIEIGSGNSSFLTARAARMNREKDGAEAEFTAIEPYPNAAIRGGFPGLSRLLPQRLETLDVSLFERLGPNDILFIDSSHVVKIDSDVVHEVLEILPRLKAGVLVHIHDVFLPAEYPAQWVLKEHRFWTEQYLLRAFLAFNGCFEVVWASSYMSLRHKELLEKAFPHWKDSHLRLPPAIRKGTLTQDGRNVWPVSFWIRRIR